VRFGFFMTTGSFRFKFDSIPIAELKLPSLSETSEVDNMPAAFVSSWHVMFFVLCHGFTCVKNTVYTIQKPADLSLHITVI